MPSSEATPTEKLNQSMRGAWMSGKYTLSPEVVAALSAFERETETMWQELTAHLGRSAASGHCGSRVNISLVGEKRGLRNVIGLGFGRSWFNKSPYEDRASYRKLSRGLYIREGSRQEVSVLDFIILNFTLMLNGTAIWARGACGADVFEDVICDIFAARSEREGLPIVENGYSLKFEWESKQAAIAAIEMLKEPGSRSAFHAGVPIEDITA